MIFSDDLGNRILRVPDNTVFSISGGSGPDAWLTRKAVAKLLNVQPQTVAAWACGGEHPLRYYKLPGTRAVRYRVSDVVAFIQYMISSEVRQ